MAGSTKFHGAFQNVGTDNVISDNLSTALRIESSDGKEYARVISTDSGERVVLGEGDGSTGIPVVIGPGDGNGKELNINNGTQSLNIDIGSDTYIEAGSSNLYLGCTGTKDIVFYSSPSASPALKISSAGQISTGGETTSLGLEKGSLHIMTGNSGGTTENGWDDLVVERTAGAAMTLLSDANNNQTNGIAFRRGTNNSHLIASSQDGSGDLQLYFRCMVNDTTNADNKFIFRPNADTTTLTMTGTDSDFESAVSMRQNTAIGPEHLNEADFASHTNWDVAGDFADSPNDATYTHSSGAGTLTQVEADLALAIQGGIFYILTYTVSGVSGSDMAATITTGIASEAVTLTVNSNATRTVSFKTKASPTDFVISATSTTGGTTFTLDDLSLRSCAGTLIVGERINCTDGGLNLRIGDADTGAAMPASSGKFNTLVGAGAGKGINSGVKNVALGTEALSTLSSASNGTAVGYHALKITTNSGNVGIGYRAGQILTSGQNCVIIGLDATTSAATSDNQIVIGAGASCDAANTAVIGDANLVLIRPGSNGNVELGNASYEWDDIFTENVTDSSDERVKEQIENTSLGLDFINRLRPVSYKLKDVSEEWETRTSTETNEDGEEVEVSKEVLIQPAISHTRKHQGLIAQEVKATLDDIGMDAADFGGYVDANISGGADKLALRYRQFIAPLIKAVQELTARIEELENG